MSTLNLWGKFHGSEATRTLEDAYRSALALTRRRMRNEDGSQGKMLRALTPGRPVRVTTGLAGLRAFGESLATWRDRPDWRTLTSYAAGCMEKFGTGGGNFRKMFAAFLEEARRRVPDMVGADLPPRAAHSARLWTELSGGLHALSKDQPGASWDRCLALAAEILEVETPLFEGLRAGP